MATLDRTRLASLLEAEQAAYTQAHPRSRALFGEADNLFGRVHMFIQVMGTRPKRLSASPKRARLRGWACVYAACSASRREASRVRSRVAMNAG